MASRKNIRSRNEEIRQVFRYLRRTERRETSYCLEIIQDNYHISQDRIYQILAMPDEPEALESPSFFFTHTVKQLEK